MKLRGVRVFLRVYLGSLNQEKDFPNDGFLKCSLWQEGNISCSPLMCYKWLLADTQLTLS